MLEQLISKAKDPYTFEGAKGRFEAARLGARLACIRVEGECDDNFAEPFDEAVDKILGEGGEVFVDARGLEKFSGGFRDATVKAFWRRRDRFYKIHALYRAQAVGMALLTGRMVMGKQLKSYNQVDAWLDALDSARIKERFAGMDLG